MHTMLDKPDAVAVPAKAAPVLRHLDHATSLALNTGFNASQIDASSRSFQSALHQFEVVLSYGKITDPRVILQALNLYLVAHQQAEGIGVFREILDRFAPTMSDETRAVYEASLAVLTATHADKIPLLERPAWVKDAFALLDAAQARTGSKHPIPHWAAGLIYADVPWFFSKRSRP